MSRICVMRAGQVLGSVEAPGEAQLLFQGAYEEGDSLVFESDWTHAVIRVDQCIAPARVYLPDKKMMFRLPLSGDNLAVYPPFAFQGEKHLIAIAPDMSNEYRNLALNPADQRGETNAYPHATANVETRNESAFCARNVLDGVRAARGHGKWPYGSWGIGARTDAEITLSFGRPVKVDAMTLYLRADFPHDAWWEQGTVHLSDGAELTFPLKQLDGPQHVALGEHVVTWMKLDHLIKCDMPSAFPALRQWEVYGVDLEEKKP